MKVRSKRFDPPSAPKENIRFRGLALEKGKQDHPFSRKMQIRRRRQEWVGSADAPFETPKHGFVKCEFRPAAPPSSVAQK
jgi:hypothetical protein